jgi:hypothetical protein
MLRVPAAHIPFHRTFIPLIFPRACCNVHIFLFLPFLTHFLLQLGGMGGLAFGVTGASWTKRDRECDDLHISRRSVGQGPFFSLCSGSRIVCLVCPVGNTRWKTWKTDRRTDGQAGRQVRRQANKEGIIENHFPYLGSRGWEESPHLCPSSCLLQLCEVTYCTLAPRFEFPRYLLALHEQHSNDNAISGI